MRLILILLMSTVLLSCAGKGLNTDRGADSRIALNKEAAQINAQLGADYTAKGEYEMANDKLQRAMKQDPRSSMAHWTYAVLQEQLKQIKTAERHYKKALQIDASDAGAQNAYASFLCRQAHYQQADRHFQKALSDPLIRGRAAVALMAGICAMEIPDYPKAQGYFEQVNEAQPNNRVVLYQLAKLNFSQNNLPLAQAYLHAYEAVSAHTSQSLWLAYRLERQLGNARIAKSYADLLIKQFPASKEAEKLARAN